MASRHRRSRHRPVRPLRRLLFGLITLGLTYGIIETLAFVAFRAIDHQPFSFSRLQAERGALREVQVDAPRETAAIPDAPAGFLSRRVVHPYLGVVPPPKRVPDNLGDQHGPVYRGPETVAGRVVPRDSETQRRPGDPLVVAIVGGSVAAGFANVGASALETHLEQSEWFANSEIRVEKLAWAGFKQPQQLLTITYLLALDIEFDVIINIDGFNEVALHPVENAKVNTFAAFPRHWYYYTTKLPENLTDEYDYQRIRRAKLAASYSRPGLRHSILANLAWRFQDRRVQADLQVAREAVVAAPPEAEAAGTMGPERSYQNDSQQMAHLASIWKQSSLQLDRISRANNIAYFHFLQPNQYVPGSKPMGDIERHSALIPNHPYRRGVLAGYPRLMAAGTDLARQGVAFVDLTGLFSETREPLYVDDCCHFNLRGHEIMAEAIARTILEHFESASNRVTHTTRRIERSAARLTR